MEKLPEVNYTNGLTPLENRDKINELIDENQKLRECVNYLAAYAGPKPNQRIYDILNN